MTTPIGAQQHPLSTPKSGPSKRQSKLSQANQAQHVPISSATIKLLPMPSSILMSNQIKWSLCASTCCFANGSQPAPTSLDIIRKVLSRLGPVTWSYCNGHDSLASTRRSFSGLEFGAMTTIPHLMTLADLTGPQIRRLVLHSHKLKQQSLPWLKPKGTIPPKQLTRLTLPSQSLFNKTIALLFSKRSTRTRISAETSATLLGGQALFLGKEDIQLGVNESPRDTARVIGGMCQGIFARVGEHSEIEVGGKCVVMTDLDANRLSYRN